MGVGETPAEAIKDAKYYHENECGELPDDPTDNIYRGDDDGEWHFYTIPEAVFNYIEEHGSGGEDSYNYWLKYSQELIMGKTEKTVKMTKIPLLGFSPQFKEKILSGKKWVTFRRFQHAEEGDTYPFDSSHMLRIKSIKQMQLKQFILLFWDADGFDSMEEACKFFENAYRGNATGDISYVYDIRGYLHEFEVIQNA